MTLREPASDPSAYLQALTREYSRFSRSAGGLSAVMGGVLCLASYLAGAVLPVTPGLRTALIATPLLWLFAKQWLANRYYQRFGHVEEQVPTYERRFQTFFIAFTALVSLIIVASVLVRLAPIGDKPWSVAIAGYTVVIAAMPFVVWRWLRTPLEFIVGVFLLCQAALAFGGRTYGFDWGTAVFPIASLALIALGWRDHRAFLRLQAELRRVIAERSAPE